MSTYDELLSKTLGVAGHAVIARIDEDGITSPISGEKLITKSSGINLYSLSKCRFEVFTREGDNVPHLHIIFDEKKVCCVCLDDAVYFPHGTKIATLNVKERKAFNQIMHSVYADGKWKGKTVWEIAVDIWNLSPHNDKKCEAAECPDYTKLRLP